MNTITTLNPATNKKIDTYNLMTPESVRAHISKAQQRYDLYKLTSFKERKNKMHKAAEILESRKDEFATTMTSEMGKTIISSRAEVEKCAWVCRYYADNAEEFLANEMVNTEATKSYISYQPIGVILAVMPWNYPFWQVFRFAAPALMAGNVALLKHASNVPQSALHIESVFLEAGFNPNTFKTLLVKSDQVESILENKHVKAATLTGSGGAGSAVASVAGKHIKKTVLELGGSDPYIILHDADIEHAADQCTQSRLLNAGQSCIGAKRFIAVESIYDEFIHVFKQKMKKATMGDPLHAVTLGPMARHDLRDEVHGQVVDSIKAGATLELGGIIPDHDGAYYPPTILTDVKPGMPAYDDEIFGPVASVIRAKNEEDAIRIANDTKFGLGACVFTKDIERGEQIAKNQIEAGCCFVNHYVKSDPRLPFGGIKTSGYGRELSYYGIREFTNVKTVYVH
jgi:succinate-semialdehyde dehydrogenase/glutarate-semialdehyde dehydrogenase